MEPESAFVVGGGPVRWLLLSAMVLSAPACSTLQLVNSAPPQCLHTRQHRIESKRSVKKEGIGRIIRNDEDCECDFLPSVLVIRHHCYGSQQQSLKKPSRDKGEFARPLIDRGLQQSLKKPSRDKGEFVRPLVDRGLQSICISYTCPCFSLVT